MSPLQFHLVRPVIAGIGVAVVCLAACTAPADEEDLVAVVEPVVCDAPDVRLAYVTADGTLVLEDLCVEGRTPAVTRVERRLPVTDPASVVDRLVWSADGRYLGVVSSWVSHFSVSSVSETFYLLGPLPTDALLRTQDVGGFVDVGFRLTNHHGSDLLGVTSDGELRVVRNQEVLGFSEDAGARRLLEYDWHSASLAFRPDNPHYVALVGSDPSSHVSVDLVSLETGEAVTVWTSQDQATRGAAEVLDITVDGDLALRWRAPGDETTTRFVVEDGRIRQLDSAFVAEDATLSPQGTWWETLRAGAHPWQFTHDVDATLMTPSATPSVYLDETDYRQLDLSRIEPCSRSDALVDQQPWLADPLARWSPDEGRVLVSFRHRDESCRALQLYGHGLRIGQKALEHLFDTPEWSSWASSFYTSRPWDAVVFDAR